MGGAWPSLDQENLNCINGIMNQYDYIDILTRSLRRNTTQFGLGKDFVFQQDNDPTNTAMNAKL